MSVVDMALDPTGWTTGTRARGADDMFDDELARSLLIRWLDEEASRSLLAGWLAGAVAALASTALMLVAIVRNPYWRRRLGWARLPLPLAALVVVNVMVLLWTLAGLFVGAIQINETQPGFNLAIAAAIGGCFVLTVLRRRTIDALTWQFALVALGSFALLMPTLDRLL